MAFRGLWESRRFMVLLFDTIISLALFFIGKYANVALEDVKFVILALQPVVLMVIYGFTKDDTALIEMGRNPGRGV